MSSEVDKTVGSAAAIASLAAAVFVANTAAPAIATITALGLGATITGAALYHKLSSERSDASSKGR
jgi:opacity protein-like surface antigen